MVAVVYGKSVGYGPYTIKEHETPLAPIKIKVEVERAMVVENTHLAMLQRSFWKSYCYQGSSLDPNTGCFNGIVQVLPSMREARRWIDHNQCSVGFDCIDCYGDASDACLKPLETARRWTASKELKTTTSNNHFARHTCNLSWGCKIHVSEYPTFLTRVENEWRPYTEHINGSALYVADESYWQLPDTVLYRTVKPKMSVKKVMMECFPGEKTTEESSCHDVEYGNFVTFKDGWHCGGKFCYRLLNKVTGEGNQAVANLHAASIEDLHRIIEGEHLLNEEMKFNFGQMFQLVNKQQQVIDTLVMSIAKIDDHLIGNLLSKNVRSEFVHDDVFYLYPTADHVVNNTNCYKESIYKNGRWQKLLDPKECVNFTDSTTLSFMETLDLWIPDVADDDITGTSSDFEGWTFYAREKQRLNDAVQFVSNAQETTSVSDILQYPKGMVNATLFGFLSSHILFFVIVLILLRYICIRKIVKDSPAKVRPTIEVLHNLPPQSPTTIINNMVRHQNENDENLVYSKNINNLNHVNHRDKDSYVININDTRSNDDNIIHECPISIDTDEYESPLGDSEINDSGFTKTMLESVNAIRVHVLTPFTGVVFR